jgi:predicted phosphoribosyltransferase
VEVDGTRHGYTLLLPFHDRRDAGRILAGALRAYRDRPHTVVLGLPRGGMVPAAEVAHALGLPLGALVCRKLRAPGNSEYAIGALAEGGTVYLDEQAVSRAGASEEYVAREVARQRGEIAGRVRRLRDGRPPALPERATVILVDDGVATGSTAIAAIRALRRRGVDRVIFAAPVAPSRAAAALRGMVDDLVVLATPRNVHSVGLFSEDFARVYDDDVIRLLGRAGPGPAEAPPSETEDSHAVA